MVKRKRVVLFHATGRLAGLHQILGVVEGNDATADVLYPTHLNYGLKNQQTAHHERTLPRRIQYREWAQVSLGQLNDFNPAQV